MNTQKEKVEALKIVKMKYNVRNILHQGIQERNIIKKLYTEYFF